MSIACMPASTDFAAVVSAHVAGGASAAREDAGHGLNAAAVDEVMKDWTGGLVLPKLPAAAVDAVIGGLTCRIARDGGKYAKAA